MAAQALLHRLQAGSAPRRLQQQRQPRQPLLLLQCGRQGQGRVLVEAAANGSGEVVYVTSGSMQSMGRRWL